MTLTNTEYKHVQLDERNVPIITGTTMKVVELVTAQIAYVMFSQDEDFLAEAKRRQAEGLTFAGVIYAHQQRVSIGDCVRDLEIIAKVCDPEDLANRVQYLPL